MKTFRDDSPIYIQLRKLIEELILDRILAEEEMIPSLRSMAKDYSINPLTVSNAIGALVEEGILYRKRGIGVFVSTGSRAKIIKTRRHAFITETLEPAILRAQQLEISKQLITERLDAIYGENK